MMGTDTIRLRPVEPADEEFLRRLYDSARREELDQVEWAPGQREAFLRSQFDAQHAAYTGNYPGAELNLIEVGGLPAGRLYLYRSASEIRIMDIALADGFRGQGAGSGLLRQVLDEGDRRGLPVTIHVEKWNPALRLYERLGFRPEADRGAYHFLKRPPADRAAGAV
jgi:ribosomal protein S18 acetylase RimI-like enzyme